MKLVTTSIVRLLLRNARPSVQGVTDRLFGRESSVRRPVSRVLFSPFSEPRGERWPFLWDARCRAPRATDPDGGAETRCRLPGVPSLFGLAPGGVCRAASVAGRAVGSYSTVSPLPARSTQWANRAGGLVSVALSLGSPPPDVIRHRVSVEPGLSSPRGCPQGAAIRPSDGR